MKSDEARRRWFREGERTDDKPSRPFGLAARLVIIAALGLLLLSRANPTAIEPVRAAILAPFGVLFQAIAPVLATGGSTLAALPASFRGLLSSSSSKIGTDAGAAADAAHAARLDALERENRSLRALLPLAGTRNYKMIAVAVIGGSTSGASSRIVVAAGRDDGIKPGYPAVMGDRLLGRVLHVHPGTAVVVRLSDRLSRVPVFVGGAETRALLVGSGDGAASLELLGPGAKPAVGDPVTSSGIGGVFPRGLMIGRVVATDGGYRVGLDSETAYEPLAGILLIEGAVFEPQEGGATVAPGVGRSSEGRKAAAVTTAMTPP